MYNGKFVSVERIIENAIRDTGYDGELDYYDVIEWIGTALDLIGVNNSYVEKITNGLDGMPDPIVIENFKGVLPCDLHIIQSCRNFDSGVAMINSSDSFLKSYSSAVGNHGNEYRINNTYIFTSFQEGNVEMCYYAYPLDDNGMPLVPDNNSVILALQKFITERIDYRLWRQGKIKGDIYSHSQQEWMWYVGQASNYMNMPSIDEMESLKNNLCRLVRSNNYHTQYFKGLSNPEKISFNKYNLILSNGTR